METEEIKSLLKNMIRAFVQKLKKRVWKPGIYNITRRQSTRRLKGSRKWVQKCLGYCQETAERNFLVGLSLGQRNRGIYIFPDFVNSAS
jgi:hypothetical protein